MMEVGVLLIVLVLVLVLRRLVYISEVLVSLRRAQFEMHKVEKAYVEVHNQYMQYMTKYGSKP